MNMKLSNKAAAILGRQLATSLHINGRNLDARRAMVDTKADIMANIHKVETRIVLDTAYYDTLDTLEPLQDGAKWR
jgi:hypothetical protein